MYVAYQSSDKTFNYRQYRKLSVAAQKSFARGREHGGWITEDDVILNPRLGERATIPPDRWAPRPEGDVTKFHTHPPPAQSLLQGTLSLWHRALGFSDLLVVFLMAINNMTFFKFIKTNLKVVYERL